MDLEKRKWEQANELTRAIKDMNNYELKTLFGIFALREKGDLKVELTYKDFCKKINLKDGGRQDELMQLAIESLMKKSFIKIPPHLSRTGNKINTFIIIESEYNKETDYLKFTLSDKVTPLLDDLKGNKTWFYLEQIIKLRKDYSPLIYQFCKSKLGINKHVKYRWYINPSADNLTESLRTWLGCEKKYARGFNALREKVIDPSIKEINEKTIDCFIEYEVFRKGKDAIALDLEIWSNKNKLSAQEDPKQVALQGMIQLDERYGGMLDTFNLNSLQIENIYRAINLRFDYSIESRVEEFQLLDHCIAIVLKMGNEAKNKYGLLKYLIENEEI